MIFLLVFVAVFTFLWYTSISTPKLQNNTSNSVIVTTYYPFPIYLGGLFHSIAFSYVIGSLYSKIFPLSYKRSVLKTKDNLSHLNLDTHVVNPNCIRHKHLILIVLPGIEGTSEDHYIKRFVRNISVSLQDDQIPLKLVTVVNFRGYGDHSSKKMSSYHNISSIDDITQAIDYIHSQFCNSKSVVMAVGFSLGSNMLAKYLSIVKKNSPIQYAISVSNPFDLYNLGDVIEKHSSFLMRMFYPWYNRKMAQGMAKKVLE